MAPWASVRLGSLTTRLGSKNCLTPKPSQSAQAPCGLLNEKSLGSNSWMLWPHCGQAKRAEKIRSCWLSPSIAARNARPSLSSIQVSSDSAKRIWISSRTLKRSTTTSMLCFLFLSSSGGLSRSTTVPLILARTNPCVLRLLSRCKCSPLRPWIMGASSISLLPGSNARIWSTIWLMVCALRCKLWSGQRGSPARAKSKRR